MNMPTFTLDGVLEAKPCLTSSEVRELWGDRESAAALDVIDAEHVKEADRVWLLCKVKKALPAEIRTRWINRTVTRAVTTHALPHPVTREWAERWLSGEDRSRESVRAAADAADAAAAWAAESAWAAAADAAWAAAAAAESAWAAASAGAAWLQARDTEYQRQLDDLLELLEGKG